MTFFQCCLFWANLLQAPLSTDAFFVSFKPLRARFPFPSFVCLMCICILYCMIFTNYFHVYCLLQTIPHQFSLLLYIHTELLPQIIHLPSIQVTLSPSLYHINPSRSHLSQVVSYLSRAFGTTVLEDDSDEFAYSPEDASAPDDSEPICEFCM